MRSPIALNACALLLFVQSQDIQTSRKRGLAHIPFRDHPQNDAMCYLPTSDLTLYKDYALTPSQSFQASNPNFVPMLWGTPSSGSKVTFVDDVQAQLKAGANVTYVRGFHEPDGISEGEGSEIEQQAQHMYGYRRLSRCPSRAFDSEHLLASDLPRVFNACRISSQPIMYHRVCSSTLVTRLRGSG